jgi:hypothetical protein
VGPPPPLPLGGWGYPIPSPSDSGFGVGDCQPAQLGIVPASVRWVIGGSYTFGLLVTLRELPVRDDLGVYDRAVDVEPHA